MRQAKAQNLNSTQPNLKYGQNEIPYCKTKQALAEEKRKAREKRKAERERAKAEAQRPLTINEIKTEPYFTHYKLVMAGSLAELYHFERPIVFGVPRRKKEENTESKNPMSEEEKAENSARRAKRKLRQRVYANAFEWTNPLTGKPFLPITLTLTFKADIRNIEKANQKFNDFMSRLNYSVNRVERKLNKKEAKKNLLKYSAVIEFQDKNRKGVVHYHILFYNLPKMYRIYDRLNEIWGKGFFWVGSKKKDPKTGKNKTFVKNQKDLGKILEYFIKYIGKNFQDPRLKDKKRYFNSRGLKDPIIIYVEELVFLIKSYLPSDALIYDQKGLSYPYKDQERFFDYAQYHLGKHPEIKKLIYEDLRKFS